MSQQAYQHLYTKTRYGKASKNACPGFRYLPQYEDWLIGSVFDFGSGSGDTVAAIRKAGFEAIGMDQVDLDNGMLVGDITAPLEGHEFRTAVCIDVFEHILDEGLEGLIANMKKAERQVIGVSSELSKNTGPDGEVLHINIKTLPEWVAFLERDFVIHKTINQGPKRCLYLTAIR